MTDQPIWAVEVDLLPKFVRELTEADLVLLREVDQHIRAKWLSEVPAMCEWLMCIAVEPEYQEDRLADFKERFNDLWVPKFGRRVAVAMYVWHVLRQSRLIDWLIRAFGWGGPL
jgi:hypothetical protein